MAMASSELSRGRTARLTVLLALVFALAIVLVCTAVGLAGAAAVDSGVITLQQLTSPGAVAAVIALGSLVLTAIVCSGVNFSLVTPLRSMTFAMEQLACGNFDYRMEKGARLRLREVDDFSEAFNMAAAELAGTEMMRASFISDFSHEFRTPINSMAGFAQLLAEDDLTDEERREYASIIGEESRRLAGLSERILLLSKMEAATVLPNVETVDVAEQLRRAVALLNRRADERAVAVDMSLDPCVVRGNADYLMQLWTNLLDNALKFSPEGGRVSIALYGGRRGEDGAASGEAVVWVSDEGCGMDADTKAHIFDRFYQGDASHASAGSGLGLTLCHRIAQLHDGSIQVQSAPGKGSVFEVRLPLCDALAEWQAWR